MALQTFTKLKEQLLKNFPYAQKIIGSGAIASVLYGFEEMLEKFSSCPCIPELNATYTAIVFAVPAVVICMICVVVFPDSRRVLLCGPGCTLPRSETRSETRSDCKICRTWAQCCFPMMTLAKVGFPSVLWMVVVFLDGSYYTCSKDRNATRETCASYCSINITHSSTDLDYYCFESRIIGASLLMVTVTLLTLLYFLSEWKCGECTVEGYYEAQYQNMLEEAKLTKVNETLEKEAKRNAEESAEQVIRTLKLGNPEHNVQQSNKPAVEMGEIIIRNPNRNTFPMIPVRNEPPIGH